VKDKQELIFLIDSILIKHGSFTEAVDRIDQCFSSALFGSDPVCIALLDESRTGKTRVFEHIESKYKRVRHDHGLEVPVLRVKVPSKPTVKGLVTVLLHSLGDPLFDKGTENAKTIRLMTLLLASKTKLLLLDEFQHFFDQASEKVQHHVTDWLKILIDDLKIGLVVAGMPSSRIIINTNEQLARRFQSPINLNRFDWKIEKDREEFKDVLYTLGVELHPFKLPKLESDNVAFRMYCATGGLMGYVIKILREATTRAAKLGTLSISMKDLNIAHDNCMWEKIPGLNSPFIKSFNKNSPDEIIDLAKLIGVEDSQGSKGKKAA